MWKWIRRWVKNIFGVLKDKPLDPDCPTCGPSLGNSPCDPVEPSCAALNAAAEILKARYDYIYTKNLYKPRLTAPKQDCAPAGGTSRLIKTDNRCQYAGEVRHYKGRAMVCLQCGTCGDSTSIAPRTDEVTGKTILTPSSTCISGNCGGGGGSTTSANGTVNISDIPTGKCMVDGTCPEVSCGYWYYVNYGRKVTAISNLSITGRSRRNRIQTDPNNLSIEPRTVPPGGGAPPAGGGQSTSSSCTPELIYDASGCKVIGIKPVLLARGTLAYWESTETYPKTLNCEEKPIYGEDAGKPIRGHKMPNRALEPHYLSRQTGVVSHLDPGNKEWGNTYARFIQLELKNVKLPENPPKPFNKTEPLTVLVMPRHPGNKSVISSGLFVNCFKGNIHGEEFAVPKNGLNGPEYFDRNIYYGGDDTHRGGENIGNHFPMVFFGPDTQFDRPGLNADTIKFELNMFGKGQQYGQCATGPLPDSKFVSRVNQKGTRSSINLSSYIKASANSAGNGSVNKCVKAIAYADANTITDKGDRFTYPLMGIHRESSVYVEAEGSPYKLRRTLNSAMPNNGHPGKPLANDGTSDYSWLGDTLWHEKPIHDASAYYGNLKTYIPNQYGGLINAVYYDLQPLALSDIQKGTVTIDRGDSFINQHYVIRKSNISDKIMEDISPLLSGGGMARNGLFGGLLRKLFENVGLEECGTCPENGDWTDPRNGGSGTSHDALRQSDPDGPWDGTGTPPPATGKDIFFFNVQKTQIIYVVESDVNLYYRQTGDPEAGEVYYRKLKGKNLDSNFPYDSDWNKGLLNRGLYVESKENPKWRMIFRVIVNLIFTYVIGAIIFILGFVTTIRALSNATAGLVFNWGFVPAMAMGVIIAVLGLLWIRTWARSDNDNRFWDNLLSIDGCWPDIVAKAGVIGSRFRIKDGRVKDFYDNWWKYNYDYSKQNEIAITLGLPDPYSTCKCPGEKTYEILFSNKQNPNSMTDAYRNFHVNSYLEIPSHSGKLKKMFRLGNRVFVQTSDAMFSLQTGSSSIVTEDGRPIHLENSTLLQLPIEMFGGLREGRGGTTDPNANEVTKWGYVNFDVEARQIGLFDGESYKVLGDFGMTKFLDKFMAFEAPDDVLRDEKHDTGVGFALGVDNARGLLHITKKDKDKKGNDRSWTLTFDMDNEAWIGFEYFHPTLYTWDRFKVYSYNENKMWAHNKVGEFSTVYGTRVPMVVDFVINDKETLGSFKWGNSTVNADFDGWDDYGLVPRKDMFFSHIGAYNTFQASGLMPVVFKKDQKNKTGGEANAQDPTKLPVSDLHRDWRFDKLIDRVHTNGKRLMTSQHDKFFTSFNKEVIGEAMVNEHFIDDYMVMRLVFDVDDTKVRVLLKHVRTSANPEQY